MIDVVRDARSLAAAWGAQRQAVEALRRVTEVANRCDIDVLPVKGVITGHTLYDDPAERLVTDLDLRVRPADLPRLRRAVHDARWREIVYSPAYRNLVFVVGDWMVDVEASVGPPGLCGLHIDAMIGRATWHTAPFGVRHRRPELHDHTLLLCVNAFKDKMVNASAGAITDLERVVERDGFRASELAVRARESGAVTITWIVAKWLVEARGALAWRDVLLALGEKSPRPLYDWLLRRAIESSDRSLFTRVLARAAADSLGQRANAFVTLGRWTLESWLPRHSPRSSR